MVTEAAQQTAPAAASGQKGIVVRMLGPFAVTCGGREAGPWPRPTARRLCQLVLVSPGRRVGRDVACDALFPSLPPRAAARALSKALSMARAALAPLGEPGTSLLSASLTHIWAAGVTVDADEQRAALRAALAMAPGADRDDALVAALADEADLLDDEPYADWAIRAREHLDELRRQARLALARDRAVSAVSAFPPPGTAPPAQGSAVGASPAGGPPSGAALSRGTPREELRPVTMLFAEVGAPAGQWDPEALREVVGGVLAAVIAEVEALGGRVTSVSGRGLQAMWGAPRAHEDDPERALRAAYRILAAIQDADNSNRRPHVPGSAAVTIPALCIGVETGPAVVGAIGGGRVEYGALGDVVAVAAHLQSRARPGTALVGPATRAAAGHLFTWGPPEPVDASLPGASVLGAAPLAGAGPDDAPLAAAPLGEPLASAGQLRLRARGPLVGRAAELAVLDGALKHALGGHGSVVVLRGDPGLGKTRLVRECRDRFMAWAGARDGRLPLWLEGRAASYTSATPYGLYQQLLAGWIGVAPDQPRPAVQAALERALVRLLASTELLPPLEHVMGMPPPTGQAEAGPARPLQNEELREAAFGALRTVISRLVPARRPAVIVLEDLHWADPTSLRFTRELISLAVGRPLLILATTRPEAGPDVDELRRSPHVRTVELRPLPDGAIRDLARALLGPDVTEEVIAAVQASVDGNPLFLEERLAALVETGALARDAGGWGLRDGSGPAVPQVLDRLVRSRIDRLGAVAQDVVRVAAVLGPEFPATLLDDVCRRELPALDLRPALDELSASGILQAAGRQHEVAYRFRHALQQDAAYYGLLRADRRRLHGHAAMALEAANADCPQEGAAVLGRHFAAAGDGPAAIRYLEVAGDSATRAFANDEAIEAYQEALAVGNQLGDADSGARLQAKLANVLWRTARRDETRAAFTAALRLADLLPQPSPLRKAHLLTRLGRLEMAIHRYDAAARAFDAAAALLGDQPGATDTEADQWLELMIDGRAEHCAHCGDADGGLAILEAVRPVLEARGNATRRYGFYTALASQRVVRDRMRASDQSIADTRRALAAAEDSRDTKDIGYATYCLGWMLCMNGDLAEGRARLLAALDIAERVGETVLRASCLGDLLMVALASHDADTARNLAPRAIKAARPLGQHVAWARAPLAWLAWQDGNTDEVLRIAAELDPAGGTGPLTGSRHGWAYLLPATAVHLGRADVASAVAAARQVLDPGQQALPDDLASAIESARRAWDAGQPDEAATALRAALDRARDLGFL
ncbi:MAG TPA: AAA family ATPase [Trebonia sp.]|nr:AAA family ATPase [Trebonia sp.]